MNYLIVKGKKYVAREGSKKAYTSKLENARTFLTRAQAAEQACGNESVVHISDVMRG